MSSRQGNGSPTPDRHTRRKPIIAILGCPACKGHGDGCHECAEQGWIVTEPTEPPVVYMTRARYDELLRQDDEVPASNGCRHDWIACKFDESPKHVRVCRWCGLGEGRDDERVPWEFYVQMVGDDLRPRP